MGIYAHESALSDMRFSAGNSKRPCIFSYPQCFMRTAQYLALILFLFLTACNKPKEQPYSDHPRLTPGVTLRDVIFHSDALQRDMQYRAILPAHIAAGEKLPIFSMVAEATFATGRTTPMWEALPTTT